MNAQQGIAFAIVGATMAAFVWGRVRYDLVALISLLASLVLGIVPPRDAFDGFKNDVVVIVACALVVSAAIARSGVVEALARPWLFRLKGRTLQVGVLAAMTAALSMMTKNVGALAVMMPLALQLARRTGASASRLLMPMSFAALAGGLVTLVGTSTNIIVSQVRLQETGRPFQMFDFAPVGLLLTLAVIVYVTLAWRLLPTHRRSAENDEDSAHSGPYVTEVRVPEHWKPARARNVGALQALSEGAVKTTLLVRGRERRANPRANARIEPGDVLVLEGDRGDLETLIPKAGLALASPRRAPVADAKEEVRVMEAVVSPGSPLVGASVGRLGLHSNFGVNLLAVGRVGGRVSQQLRSAVLRAGDVLVLQASERTLPGALAKLGARPLAEREPRLGAVRRGLPAIIILAAAMILAGLRIAPVSLAFFGAAVGMIMVGAISMRQAYDSLDGHVLILIAALIPVSEAVQRIGGTAVLSSYLFHLLTGAPPMLVLGSMMALAMVLAPFLHNAPTVLILGPVAAQLATAMHLRMDAFLMGVAVGAGCDFLTPVGHQCNTLILGPGGYKFADYPRFGAPLSLLVIALGAPIIAWIWGLS
ncbi:MAG TPA: SLC13 family permease [Caulobacteraceae bacterium]|nr:SLC13 family permease [Caulobacteraceae bacterium]